MIRFLALFFALLGAYYALMRLPVCERIFVDYLKANARASNVILRGLGENTRVSGISVRSARHGITVRRGCDALEPAWVFCAAVIAFPAPWRRKRVVLPAGAALIFTLNLGRIVSLYLIGQSAPAWFPAAHLEWWPAAFMLVVLLLWLAWVRSIGHEPR